MPHWTPQKQQCVFTSLKSACSAQPPGGSYWRCGPYLPIKLISSSVGVAMLLTSQHPSLIQSKQPPAARRADVLVVDLSTRCSESEVESHFIKDSLEVLDVKS